MKTHTVVTLQSIQAIQLLHYTLSNNRRLFQTALKKLDRVFARAKQQHVYALIRLFECHQAIEQVRKRLTRQRQQLEIGLQRQFGHVPTIHVNKPLSVRFAYRCPSSLLLIETLRQFDQLQMIFSVARSSQLIKAQKVFFKLKHAHKKRLCRVLSTIVGISEQRLPQVTIKQFRENDLVYRLATTVAGEVGSETLEQALNAAEMPFNK